MTRKQSYIVTSVITHWGVNCTNIELADIRNKCYTLLGGGDNLYNRKLRFMHNLKLSSKYILEFFFLYNWQLIL